MYVLDDSIRFPPVELADEDGLLAIGGDLRVERLLLAYAQGIFPWYNESDPICWWSPDPRCVLFPENLVVSKSMRKLLRDNAFDFTINRCFEDVMRMCMTVRRKDGNGTWIQEEMVEAYTRLHRLGFAWSAESWKSGELAGGLYGVRIGKVLFGESMFTLISNAGKYAFTRFVESERDAGLRLVDCQQRTPLLESLGAEMIPRRTFINYLETFTPGHL